MMGSVDVVCNVVTFQLIRVDNQQIICVEHEHNTHCSTLCQLSGLYCIIVGTPFVTLAQH